MAELLIRVVDKISTDTYINGICTKRGDVIAVKPDGWNWSIQERRNPQWIILKTDLTMEEALVYIRKGRVDPLQDRPNVPRRAIKIDIDSVTIPLNIRTQINNASRTESVIDVSSFDVRTLAVTKPVSSGTPIR